MKEIERLALHWTEETPAFKRSAAKGAVDPLPKILEAFKSSQFDYLRDHGSELQRMKQVLRKRKDELFDLHMDGPHRVILEYPLAR